MNAQHRHASLLAILMTSALVLAGCTASELPAALEEKSALAAPPAGASGAGSAAGEAPAAGKQSPPNCPPCVPTNPFGNTRAAMARLQSSSFELADEASDAGVRVRESPSRAKLNDTIVDARELGAALALDLASLDLLTGLGGSDSISMDCCGDMGNGTGWDRLLVSELMRAVPCSTRDTVTCGAGRDSQSPDEVIDALDASAMVAESAQGARLDRLGSRLAAGSPRDALAAALDEQRTMLGSAPATLRSGASASPSAAMLGLLELVGVAATTAELDDIKQLDSFREPARTAFVLLLDALTVQDAVLKESLEGDLRALRAGENDTRWNTGWSNPYGIGTTLPAPGGVPPEDALAQAGIDLSRILAAREAVALATLDFAAAVEVGGVPEGLSDIEIGAPGSRSSERGDDTGCKFSKVAFFPQGHTHTTDYWLLIDVFGADTYHNNAGGNTCGGECSWIPWAVALDLRGSDVYGNANDNPPRGCGVLGGAIGYPGIGILADVGATSDTYDAGSMGAIGGGFGVAALGLLFDNGGADAYKGGSTGVNGGGSLLAGGVLFDVGASDDLYQAESLGVNGGGAVAAVGFHYDAGGDDTYIAQGVGANGGGVGGVGLLFNDGSGSDTYTAKDVGVNGGAMLGAGVLHDSGGADAYTAEGGATNGGAVLGFGFIFDKGIANDLYIAKTGATNGGGVFIGFGHIKDHGGDDDYYAEDLATNGGAFLLATGKINDLDGGDDSYTATSVATNGGGVLVARGRIFDHGGADVYAAGDAATNGGGDLLGWGNIQDDGGNDIYRAGSIAVNGGGSLAGWGRILDKGGDDIYIGQSCGVNGGACFGGNGTLLDWGGADKYSAVGLGVNGGGFATLLPGVIDSKGLLFDLGGNDSYTATKDGSLGVNGGGALWGVGHLRDEQGFDSYTAGDRDAGGDCGVNGGACWMGDGDLTDLGIENDSYQAGSRGVNGGIFNTEHQGTLIDQCGSEKYWSRTDGTNGGAAWSFAGSDDMGAAKLLDLGGANDTYLAASVSVLDVTAYGKGTRHGDQIDVNGLCLRVDAPSPTGGDNESGLDDNETPLPVVPVLPDYTGEKPRSFAATSKLRGALVRFAVELLARLPGAAASEGGSVEPMLAARECPPLDPEFCGPGTHGAFNLTKMRRPASGDDGSAGGDNSTARPRTDVGALRAGDDGSAVNTPDGSASPQPNATRDEGNAMSPGGSAMSPGGAGAPSG